MLFQLAGNENFLKFSERVAGRRKIQILCQLLRDGACSARHALFIPILLCGFLDLSPVEARMREERAVLGNQYGISQMNGDFFVRDPGVEWLNFLILLFG